ncbi:hypothetical protein [Hymenobacter ruber]
MALLVGCAPEHPQEEAVINQTKTYDLGTVSITIPEVWKSTDYTNLDSVPTRKYKRFLFLNTASRDTVRETLVVMIDEREGIKHVDKAATEMVKNFSVPNQMQLLASHDTLLHNGNLAIVESTCRNLELRLDLAITCAFYKKENKMISLMGMAVSHPGTTDKNTRAMFRQMINSIKWQ